MIGNGEHGESEDFCANLWFHFTIWFGFYCSRKISLIYSCLHETFPSTAFWQLMQFYKNKDKISFINSFVNINNWIVWVLRYSNYLILVDCIYIPFLRLPCYKKEGRGRSRHEDEGEVLFAERIKIVENQAVKS